MFGILVKDLIFSMEDISSLWKKKEMEHLMTEADRLTIQGMAYPTATTFNKTHFNRAIQELYLTDQIVTLSPSTTANFKKILSFCAEELE